jgi:hypothetical protein
MTYLGRFRTYDNPHSMTPTHCTGERGRTVAIHATRDATTPAAATGPLKIAAFKQGTRAQCRCAAGECKESECDALYVMDESGNRLATFHGKGWRALSNETDPLTVYRMPGSATQDAGKSPLTLARLNEMHRKFYEGGS